MESASLLTHLSQNCRCHKLFSFYLFHNHLAQRGGGGGVISTKLRKLKNIFYSKTVTWKEAQFYLPLPVWKNHKLMTWELFNMRLAYVYSFHTNSVKKWLLSKTVYFLYCHFTCIGLSRNPLHVTDLGKRSMQNARRDREPQFLQVAKRHHFTLRGWSWCFKY